MPRLALNEVPLVFLVLSLSVESSLGKVYLLEDKLEVVAVNPAKVFLATKMNVWSCRTWCRESSAGQSISGTLYIDHNRGVVVTPNSSRSLEC